MSQILYRCPHEKWGDVEIQTGWDRVTQSFHWTVFGNDEEILDSDWISSDMTAFGVCLHLRGLGLKVPYGLEDTLREHREQNIGNIRVRMALD